MKYGIVVFDGVEALDACGPFEVFSVAARLHNTDAGNNDLTVTLISAYPDRLDIVARGGLRMKADIAIENAPAFDVLVIPGGVTKNIERDPTLLNWPKLRACTPMIASVCTGAFLLAEAGILTDHTVTTHWEDQTALSSRYPRLTVINGPRWVQQDHVYTSAGISAGLDLALHLLTPVDSGLPSRVAGQMDYH